MKTPSWYIPRRTLLRATGVAVGLPSLEAMVLPGARAAGPPPRRVAVVGGMNNGFVGRRDLEQNTLVAPWTPKRAGNGPLENNLFLKPFFDKGLDSKITVITGLSDRVNSAAHSTITMTSPGLIEGTNANA